MNRFFTVIEGEGKGQNKPLTSALMIVGRSKNADLQIEDALVSRRHVEVRVEADAVFVENKSTSGSVLNGKPLVGIVSLNSGDVLEIGNTKLRYEETATPTPARGRSPSVEAMESELDGTRIADENVVMQQHQDKDAEPDATRAIVEDGTRMLNAAELPNWVAQENKQKDGPAKSKGLGIIAALLILVLGGAGFGYWYFIKSNDHTLSGAVMAYKDSLYDFNLEYPLDWSKAVDQTGVVGYGSGKSGDSQWVQMNIYTDKTPEHALTGLTDGFVHYQDEIKARYKDFDLNGSKPMTINGAKVVYYAFSTAAYQAKGIYALNAESRIVVECVCSRNVFGQYSSVFSTILQSFQFGDMAPQQVIDFPLPDDGMQQLALANPEGLAHQVDEDISRGQMLLASKDVKPDNLYESVMQYRKALQLAIAAPQRLPAYRDAAQGLVGATTLLNQAISQQRFEISRALKEGDRTAAYWAANKLMQMMPDKNDDDYQRAYKLCQQLQPSL
jgi:pSer/pThr/pTyr-binding forkhead associated (FHA) protein